MNSTVARNRAVFLSAMIDPCTSSSVSEILDATMPGIANIGFMVMDEIASHHLGGFKRKLNGDP